MLTLPRPGSIKMSRKMTILPLAGSETKDGVAAIYMLFLKEHPMVLDVMCIYSMYDKSPEANTSAFPFQFFLLLPYIALGLDCGCKNGHHSIFLYSSWGEA
jgi:hypothetical protein